MQSFKEKEKVKINKKIFLRYRANSRTNYSQKYFRVILKSYKSTIGTKFRASGNIEN